MFKEEIRKILNSIQNVDNLNEEYLIKTILEFLINIADEKIDNKKSKIELSTTFNINLISKNNQSIDVYINVQEPCIVNIQIGEGAEYVYYESHNSYSDINKLVHSLTDLFTCNVREKLLLKNDKIIYAHYFIKHIILNNEKWHEYSIRLGSSFSLFKKKAINNVYQPWINV